MVGTATVIASVPLEQTVTALEVKVEGQPVVVNATAKHAAEATVAVGVPSMVIFFPSMNGTASAAVVGSETSTWVAMPIVTGGVGGNQGRDRSSSVVALEARI